MRTAEDVVEKIHGAGGVSERSQPGVMQGGDQKAGGDADRFLNVVVFDFAAIGQEAVTLGEDGNEVGRGFEEGFVFVCADGGEGFEPFLWGAVVIELALLFFGGDPNLAFDFGVADNDEVPGLKVCAVGGGSGGTQTVFDDLARHRSAGVFTHGAAAFDLGVKVGGPAAHLVDGVFVVGSEGDEDRLGHGWRFLAE